MNDEQQAALETLTGGTGSINDLERAYWVLMGDPSISGVYVAKSAYASLPAASGYPEGTQAFATDIGVVGSAVIADGGEWVAATL